MARSFLDLPPELLLHTLAFLPIQALLRFGSTSRYSQALATSSLHSLSLGIFTSQVSALVSKPAATRYPHPTKTTSVFPELPATPSALSNGIMSDNLEREYFTDESLNDDDPYRVCVVIPKAKAFSYATLLRFHTALTESILDRHGDSLRNLDLSLWSLTKPIAEALAALPALRALSLRIDGAPHVRGMPRSRNAKQRPDQLQAWDLLSKTAIWAPRLEALRVEGGELSAPQLMHLLGMTRRMRELWLCKCTYITAELWNFLGSEWKERSALRVLNVMRCSTLNEGALDAIGGMRGLQFLSLQECYGVDSETVEERNKTIWGIAEVVLPAPKMLDSDASSVIEVDPAYMVGEV